MLGGKPERLFLRCNVTIGIGVVILGVVGRVPWCVCVCVCVCAEFANAIDVFRHGRRHGRRPLHQVIVPAGRRRDEAFAGEVGVGVVGEVGVGVALTMLRCSL